MFPYGTAACQLLIHSFIHSTRPSSFHQGPSGLSSLRARLSLPWHSSPQIQVGGAGVGPGQAPSICGRVLCWVQVSDGCSGSTRGKTRGADTGQGGALTERQGSLQGRNGGGLQAEWGQKEQGLPGPPGETRSSGLAQVPSESSHS